MASLPTHLKPLKDRILAGVGRRLDKHLPQIEEIMADDDDMPQKLDVEMAFAKTGPADDRTTKVKIKAKIAGKSEDEPIEFVMEGKQMKLPGQG